MKKIKKDKADKKAEYMAQFRHKCKYCGHTIYMSEKYSKKICNWCNNMNYLDKKQEFEEKLKNALKKVQIMI